MVLECEKRSEKDKIRIEEEPLWTMYRNGKKNGYNVRREPTEEDLFVMELRRRCRWASMFFHRDPRWRRAVVRDES
ncbi:hypothetical protein ACSQ67_008298 [Phaseolus vulgaris]